MALVPVREGGDDVPQRRERLVDVLGLVQDRPLRPRLAHLLRAGLRARVGGIQNSKCNNVPLTIWEIEFETVLNSAWLIKFEV